MTAARRMEPVHAPVVFYLNLKNLPFPDAMRRYLQHSGPEANRRSQLAQLLASVSDTSRHSLGVIIRTYAGIDADVPFRAVHLDAATVLKLKWWCKENNVSSRGL